MVRAMLDLGTSFVASVARDPDALAIVDGDTRLTYRQWYDRISALVASFDELELEAGDHLVTLLQNRWEAATVHWACQFAGVIVTPLNWRATADELDYVLADAEAKAVVYEDVSARIMGGGEVLVANAVPLRAGYRFDQGAESHSLSGGVGYLGREFSIEGSVRRTIAGPDATVLVFSVAYFLESSGLARAGADL